MWIKPTFLVFGNWKALLLAAGVGVVASDGGCDVAGVLGVVRLLPSSALDTGSTILLAVLALLLIRLFLQGSL